MEIKVEFSSSALWGNIEPNEEGYDEQLSESQFAMSLHNHIYDEYPNAEIEIVNSINDRVMVDGDGEDINDDARDIGEIVNKVWNGDSWMVFA